MTLSNFPTTVTGAAMSSDRGGAGPPAEGANDTSPEDLVTMTRAEFEALRARSGPEPLGASKDGLAPGNEIENGAATGEAGGREVQRVLDREGNRRSAVEEFSSNQESRLVEETAARERKAAELDRAYRAALRDRALAITLCGRPLVNGAALQLIKLWRDDFDVHEENGEIRISSRDGRTIDQAVNEWLGSSEYAHFSLPSSRGGAGSKEGHRSAASDMPGNSPKNLGEAIVQQWRKEASASANDPNKAIGLKRHR